MKNFLTTLFLMLCIACAYAQQDSIIVDYTQEVNYKKEFHYTHVTKQCTYLLCNDNRAIKVPISMAEKLKLEPCPYCTGGKDYELKVGSQYIPIYFSSIHEFKADSEEKSSQYWTEAEGGRDSKYGLIWFGIVHERLTNNKISAIKSAHAAVILSSIAAGMSATASVLSSAQGNFHSAHTSLFNATNSTINAGFASAISKSAEDFEIVALVKNISDREVQVNNESRGLVWHLLPGQAIEFGGVNSFSELIRIESKTADSTEVSYCEFVVKNHLLKVKPLTQKELWRTFRSLPFERSQAHFLDPDEKNANSILYEYNLETGAHRRVENK